MQKCHSACLFRFAARAVMTLGLSATCFLPVLPGYAKEVPILRVESQIPKLRPVKEIQEKNDSKKTTMVLKDAETAVLPLDPPPLVSSDLKGSGPGKQDRLTQRYTWGTQKKHPIQPRKSPAVRKRATGRWIAREAVGKRVPLGDPLNSLQVPSIQTPSQNQSVAKPDTQVSSDDTGTPLSNGMRTEDSGAQIKPKRHMAAPAKSPPHSIKKPNAKDPSTSFSFEASDLNKELDIVPREQWTLPSLEGLNPVPMIVDEAKSDIAEPSMSDQSAESEPGLETDPPSGSDLHSEQEPTDSVISPPSTKQRLVPDSTESALSVPDQKSLPIRRPTIPFHGEQPSETSLDTNSRASKSDSNPLDGTAARLIPSDSIPLSSVIPQEIAPLFPGQEPDRGLSEQADVEPLHLPESVLRLKIPSEKILQSYYRRPENVARRSAWGLLHSIMVYGVDTQVIVSRQRRNAISWLAGNNYCRNKRMFSVNRQNKIIPLQGVGLQGHQSQLLAVFGLVGLSEDYELYAGNRRFSVKDLIEYEKRACRSEVRSKRGQRKKAELTFTLIALAHYLDTDAKWRASNGETWDFPRLIREELAQPIVGAACGGTHRLMGLSHAIRIRKAQGLPFTSEWARADKFIDDFIEYAWTLQMPDGSMSTNWFKGRADNGQPARKLQTTGHIVEWLLCNASQQDLQDSRMVRAINFLVRALRRNPAGDKQVGPKGHALRSVALYHQKVFGGPEPWLPVSTANQRRTASW